VSSDNRTLLPIAPSGYAAQPSHTHPTRSTASVQPRGDLVPPSLVGQQEVLGARHLGEPSQPGRRVRGGGAVHPGEIAARLRHGATRERPLVVSRSGTIRQLRTPPGSQAIPRLGAGPRLGRGVTPGRADAISIRSLSGRSIRSAQPVEPTRGAGARDASWGTGVRPRLPRVERHSSGNRAWKPASSATCRRAGEASLTRNATPASLAA
jgi:hypothetical protein